MSVPRRFTRPDGVRVDPPAWRKMTGFARMAPSFLVIGAQRCGSTSLYRYISMHPQVLPALRKEVHYFDFQYGKGRAWYLAHFPGAHRRLTGGRRTITGEASPYYMVHPLAPERVRAFNPEMKLIAILRDPVDRALSHYHHEVRHRVEPLTFEEAIDIERERLSGTDRRLREVPHHYCYNHHHFSYLDRGRYAHYLEAWLTRFPRENLLVLRSEDMFENVNRVVNAAFAFLGLPPHEVSLRGAPAASYAPMSPALRDEMQRYFAADQERLAVLLG